MAITKHDALPVHKFRKGFTIKFYNWETLYDEAVARGDKMILVGDMDDWMSVQYEGKPGLHIKVRQFMEQQETSNRPVHKWNAGNIPNFLSFVTLDYQGA